MINFNTDMTEIIEERKRISGSRPKRVNMAAETKRAATMRQIEDIQYNMELRRINSDDY